MRYKVATGGAMSHQCYTTTCYLPYLQLRIFSYCSRMLWIGPTAETYWATEQAMRGMFDSVAYTGQQGSALLQPKLITPLTSRLSAYWHEALYFILRQRSAEAIHSLVPGTMHVAIRCSHWCPRLGKNRGCGRTRRIEYSLL